MDYLRIWITTWTERERTSFRFSSMAFAVSNTGDTIPLVLPLTILPPIHLLLHLPVHHNHCSILYLIHLPLLSSDRKETSNPLSNQSAKVIRNSLCSFPYRMMFHHCVWLPRKIIKLFSFESQQPAPNSVLASPWMICSHLRPYQFRVPGVRLSVAGQNGGEENK